jgi:hypothetical protein
MEAKSPDWSRLDNKAKDVVDRIFNNLPGS